MATLELQHQLPRGQGKLHQQLSPGDLDHGCRRDGQILCSPPRLFRRPEPCTLSKWKRDWIPACPCVPSTPEITPYLLSANTKPVVILQRATLQMYRRSPRCTKAPRHPAQRATSWRADPQVPSRRWVLTATKSKAEQEYIKPPNPSPA